MSGRKHEGYRTVPEDYAIDGLALEAERRSKELGRPYSYGQLVADTTEEERGRIAEGYRRALTKAIRRGKHRVSGGTRAAFLGEDPPLDMRKVCSEEQEEQ